MAQTIFCDGCQQMPAMILVTNIETGDVLGFCPPCSCVWAAAHASTMRELLHLDEDGQPIPEPTIVPPADWPDSAGAPTESQPDSSARSDAADTSGTETADGGDTDGTVRDGDRRLEGIHSQRAGGARSDQRDGADSGPDSGAGAGDGTGPDRQPAGRDDGELITP